MRHTIKIPLLLSATTVLAASCLAAKIPVYLKPVDSMPVFREVEASELLLPQDAPVANAGWKQATLPVGQTGYTKAVNVMKELTLQPGSKVHTEPKESSNLIGRFTGKEAVQILEPGEWTKVVLTKPLTVYFTEESLAATEVKGASETIALLPPLLPPASKKESVDQAAGEAAQPERAPEFVEPLRVVVRTELSAAAAPTSRISEFDALESVDPAEVRRRVGSMSNTILDQIRELDPLEVRESAPSQLDPQKLNLELKPTVSISRDFNGKLIYKKAAKTLTGTITPPGFSPYQLVDADGQRLAYVRVEEIKVGNILNYVNQQVILSGPLEENVGGDTPVVQGRILRLDPAFLGQPAEKAPTPEK